MIPTFISKEKIIEFSNNIGKSFDPKEKEQLTSLFLIENYDEAMISMCNIFFYKQNLLFSPFYKTINESIELYYLKYYQAAIISLIPVIEGITRKIGDLVDISIKQEINKNEFIKVFKKYNKIIIKNDIFRGYD